MSYPRAHTARDPIPPAGLSVNLRRVSPVLQTAKSDPVSEAVAFVLGMTWLLAAATIVCALVELVGRFV